MYQSDIVNNKSRTIGRVLFRTLYVKEVFSEREGGREWV